MKFKRVAQLRTPEQFREYQKELGIEIGFDEELQTAPESPLAQTYTLPDGFVIGNRWCIQPMEGWDGTPDGKPSEHHYRRWGRFGESGAKLMWGCEAVAVRHDGRANPHQLLLTDENAPEIGKLREHLVESHVNKFGTADDLLVGIQLTHSGRFARPNTHTKLEPTIAYHHPYLDEKFNISDDHDVISDKEIEELIQLFIEKALVSYELGFDFIDLKHCHGYLGHEFLSAVERPGPYGGSFENRTRFLREIVAGVRKHKPDARIGVRVSIFDMPPFKTDPVEKIGVPIDIDDRYPYAFGSNPDDPFEQQLTESIMFLDLLRELNIPMVNLSAGSPYYVPHIMRPALFPPSDGYLPPEDPLVGVARQLKVAAELREHTKGLLTVGTSYSYLQDWLPNVAQYQIRNDNVDFIGLGRIVLSYHDLPTDVMEGTEFDRKRFCRTFSDCTTGPRMGIISGCFPLDSYYKEMPIHEDLKEFKKTMQV